MPGLLSAVRGLQVVTERLSVTVTPKLSLHPGPHTHVSSCLLSVPQTELLVFPKRAAAVVGHTPAPPFLWVLGPELRDVACTFLLPSYPTSKPRKSCRFYLPRRAASPLSPAGLHCPLSTGFSPKPLVSLAPPSPPCMAARVAPLPPVGFFPHFCRVPFSRSPPPGHLLREALSSHDFSPFSPGSPSTSFLDCQVSSLPEILCGFCSLILSRACLSTR